MHHVPLSTKIRKYEAEEPIVTFNELMHKNALEEAAEAGLILAAIRGSLDSAYGGFVLPTMHAAVVLASDAFGDSFHDLYSRSLLAEIKERADSKEEARRETQHAKKILDGGDIFLFGGPLLLLNNTFTAEEREKAEQIWCVGEIVWNCPKGTPLDRAGSLDDFLASIPEESFVYGSCARLSMKTAKATQYIMDTIDE